jgi:peptidoglycan/LPS O-acetylase OafA/YrhL
VNKLGDFAYLDGLRGLAALSVVLNHCILFFFPAMIEGAGIARVHNAFEATVPFSCFNWLFSAGFSVSLFFVLSGFVLGIGYFKKRQKSVVIKAVLKRYPRLLIPTFFVSLFSFLLLRHHFYANVAAAQITHSHWIKGEFQFEPSVWLFLKETVFDVFLKEDSVSFNPVLWTMHVEFLGSLLVFALLLGVGSQQSVCRYVVYALISLILVVTNHAIYAAFIMGLSLCDLTFQFPNGLNGFIPSRLCGFALLVFALFLGNIPIGLSESPALFLNTVYAPFLLFGEWLSHAKSRSIFMFWEIVAATLALASVLSLRELKRFLALKWAVWLGRVSFMLYLVHVIILFSLGAWLFIQWMGISAIASYNAAAVFSSLVVILLSLGLAKLLTPVLDESAVVVSVNFANYCFKLYLLKVESLYRFGGGLYASLRKTGSEN